MQGSKRTRFGGMVLAIWAVAVLAMLIAAWLGKNAAGGATYDGAMLVEKWEGACDRHA